MPRENVHRQPLWILAALSWSVLPASCTSGPGTGPGGTDPPRGICRRNTVTSACRCAAGSQADNLQADEEVVANCDTPPAGVRWECCYSVNALGVSDRCECAPYLCARDSDTDNCRCAYMYRLLVGSQFDNESIVPSCSGRSSCCGDDQDCACYQTVGQGCVGGQPGTCRAPPSRACSGDHLGTSCAGLRW